MSQALGDDLTPAQRERVRAAARRSVVTFGLTFSALFAYSLVSAYGAPWHWQDLETGPPWGSVVFTGLLVVGLWALAPGMARSRYAAGPVRDLAACGGWRDIARTAWALAVGRVLDERSRPVGRALVALHRARSISAAVFLALAVALVMVVVVTRGERTWWVGLGLAGALALWSVTVLVWSELMRRNAVRQGLAPPRTRD